jgi:tRNA G18 (ribose-2'-O)-methylase SpoU
VARGHDDETVVVVPPPLTIDDPRDPRVAEYTGLTDAALRRGIELGGRLFIAEGELVIRRLVRSPYPIRSVLLTAERYDRLAGDLEGVNAPIYLARQSVMDAVTGFPIHRGAVASASRLPLPPVDELLVGARNVAILEGLNDHENVGAVFRNAAAFGLDAVLLSPTCADPLYRRAVRVSLGHVLSMPFAFVDQWPDELVAMAAAGWETVALTPAGSRPVDDLDDLIGPVAVLVGAEGPGLSDAALAAAGRRLRIAIADGVDSLNVATAAAIAFHHLARRP